MSELVITDELKKDVSINLADLDREMIEHASMYIHYAVKTVNARKNYDSAKNRLEIITAKIYAQIRSEFSDTGVKATESMIDAALKVHPTYIKLQQDVIDAQATWRLCEVAETAFNQRKDMLLELARDRRKEREGQLRVLDNNSVKNSVLFGLEKQGATS